MAMKASRNDVTKSVIVVPKLLLRAKARRCVRLQLDRGCVLSGFGQEYRIITFCIFV